MTATISRRDFLKVAGGAISTAALTRWGWDNLLEWFEIAQLPPLSANTPNVMIVVLDTVRARNLSLYGYHRPTVPKLEKLARTGVLFKQAISPAPWTLPSHASMFTGRLPHELSADWVTPLDSTYPTLAEILSRQGYLTAGFVSNQSYCSYEHGLNRGFIHFEDYLVSPGQLLRSSSLGRNLTNNLTLRSLIGYHEILGRKSAAKLNEDFLRWLSHHDQGPFFAFLNYFDAHNPYLPPAPFDVMFGNKPRKAPGQLPEKWWTEDEIQAEIDAYDGTIAYLDDQLNLLLDELKDRKILDNTLLIITSDHGEEFGEHNLYGHGRSLYWSSLHVPLLISFPSHVPAGEIVQKPVSLVDLPATVIDLLGLGDIVNLPGNSLARVWQRGGGEADLTSDIVLSVVNPDPRLPHNRFPIGKGPMKSLVADGYHYILNGDDVEELYDIENDPNEKDDLTKTAIGHQEIERFRVSLYEILTTNT